MRHRIGFILTIAEWLLRLIYGKKEWGKRENTEELKHLMGLGLITWFICMIFIFSGRISDITKMIGIGFPAIIAIWTLIARKMI